MNNTMKSIVFIASLFSFLILIILFNYILTIFFNNYQPPIYISFIFIALSYISILFVQAYVRKLYVKKKLEGLNIIFEVPAKTIRTLDKVLIYILPGVFVLLPLIYRPVFDVLTQLKLIIFVFLIALIELVLSITKKTMKAVVTDGGIAIAGTDLRLELPINANYTNASGFYPFERLDSYLIVNDEIFIEQSFDLSTIKLKCSLDQIKQLKAILIKNGINETRDY